MNKAILFKVLHRRFKFRNPNQWLDLPEDFKYTQLEYESALKYLETLWRLNIKWTYPGHEQYPKNFLKMKEPPLFIEYLGKPFWNSHPCLSIVGSRKIHSLTEAWLKLHLSEYLSKQAVHAGVTVCVVSGGAYGVDQLAHFIAIKQASPTVVVVPSGLIDMYPKNLKENLNSELVCYLSEFETDQKLHKSHFYFRNRLIAALGEITFMVQADIKSGSLLTVHHALENGRPIITLPSHPQLIGFGGNLKLLQDGAYMVSSSLDLFEFWNAEITTKNYLMT
ncbi:MAG: DNA-processing protein DprA [Pseudobdellovibrio sp.]